jgi:phage terminase small subunit
MTQFATQHAGDDDMPHTRIEPKNERMLKPKEALFVGYYMEHSNAKLAAELAGLKNAQGLLNRPQIRKEIKRRMDQVMSKKQITAERVVEELGKIAFANIDDFVDSEYRLGEKPGRRKMAAVQEVTTETILGFDDSDGNEVKPDVKRVKMKMYSKLDALDKLGRHFGMFTDKVQITGDLSERLNRAFDRLSEEGAEPK